MGAGVLVKVCGPTVPGEGGGLASGGAQDQTDARPLRALVG
ncbi:hypothetical protein [Deinococcus aetherius]|nr:hypothetical protein [Deinococcus aetherius]